MIWELSHLVGPCGACRQDIPAGAPILRVTDARLVRCQDCAKRVFGAEPPDTLEAPLAVTGRTSQPTVMVTPKGFARDYKVAQSGDGQ